MPRKPAAPKPAQYSAPITARLLTSPCAVQLSLPAFKMGTTPEAKRLAHQAEAMLIATAHRVAAEICMLNVDVGASIADPHVSSGSTWVALVTVEGAEDAREEAAILKMITEACARMGVTLKG